MARFADEGPSPLWVAMDRVAIERVAMERVVTETLAPSPSGGGEPLEDELASAWGRWMIVGVGRGPLENGLASAGDRWIVDWRRRGTDGRGNLMPSTYQLRPAEWRLSR